MIARSVAGDAVVPGQGRALTALGTPPERIEPLSLARLRARIVEAGVALPEAPADAVVLRMAYAAGDASLAPDCAVTADAVHAAVTALRGGADVVCDVAMVAAGVASSMRGLPGAVLVAVDHSAALPASPLASAQTRDAVLASTRTARGLLALAARLPGSVVVIGNAPTALLALIDLLADGVEPPAAVIAAPCGQVAAAESKALLLRVAPCPTMVVRGTRGGSAVAAAALNACCRLAGNGSARA